MPDTDPPRGPPPPSYTGTASHPFLPNLEAELRRRFARARRPPAIELDDESAGSLEHLHWSLWTSALLLTTPTVLFVGSRTDRLFVAGIGFSLAAGALASRRWPWWAARGHALLALGLCAAWSHAELGMVRGLDIGPLGTAAVTLLPVFSLSMLVGAGGALVGLAVAFAVAWPAVPALAGAAFLDATLALIGLHVRAQHARIRRARDRLQAAALSDPLTGLGNLRAFERDLAHQRSLARRLGVPLLVTLWDLDGLKQVNDRFGHPLGDAYLMRFADVLRSAHRSTDGWYRLGGDEFAGLHLNLSDGTLIASRTRSAFSAVSVGWARADDRSDQEARAVADKLLYQDKESRRAQTDHRIAEVLASLEAEG